MIVETLFDICLLRKGPEDLPCNSLLVLMLAVASFVVSVLLGSMTYDLQTVTLSAILDLFISFVFVKSLLLKKPERFAQTLSAILGAVTLINIISLPVIYTLSIEDLSEDLVLLLSMLSFVLFIWIVVVNGFIFSRAFSSMLGYGIAISVAYALLSIIVLESFLATRVAH